MGTEFGRAITTEDDTRAAVAGALGAALENISRRDDIVLVVTLNSPSYDAETILDVIEEELGSVPVIGSTTSGEFTDERVTDDGLAVAIIASDDLAVETAVGSGITADVFGAVQEATDQLSNVDDRPGDYSAGITFHDGLAGRGEEVTLVTNDALGDIPLAGGSAGDNLAMAETLVYNESTVASDGVVIALLSGSRPFGLAAEHGHEPISATHEVTDAEENVINEIDGRPAFEVWREAVVGETELSEADIDQLDDDPDRLVDLMVKYEFGFETAEGEYKIRWPGLTDSTDGPMTFATGVPEGAEVRIMRSPKQGQIDSAGEAARRSLDSFDGDDDALAGALIFDCACRDLILGDDFDLAVEELANELAVPLIGFETYGEVCMPEGATSGFHNTTTAVLLIPK